MTKGNGYFDGSRLGTRALSRREVLRAGSVLIPATAIVPGLFTRPLRAATASNTFDFYIAPNGNDSNPGTLASPWSITAINTRQSIYAGKRVGIVAGTYDISNSMGTFQNPVLNINGGPNASTPTYIGSCNSSGVYQARAATITAKGNGIYGGGHSNLSYMIGTCVNEGGGGGPTPPNWGNWVLDGVRITGFSIWAVAVGTYDGSGGAVPNVTIQNCEIFDGNGSNAPYGGRHTGCLEFYHYANLLLNNCYIHDVINTNVDLTHFAAITVWGGFGNSTGLNIQHCTIVKAGTTYGIYDVGNISGTTIQQCYFDLTSIPGNGNNAPNAAIYGFGKNTTSGAAGSVFRNNIIRGGYAIDTQGQDSSQQWATTAAYYNNTWDLAGGAGQNGGGVGFRFAEASGHARIFSCYNNLIYDNGAKGVSGGYGYNSGNVDGYAVCDYNIYGTLDTFSTYAANGGGGATSRTFAAWKAAIGNLEAHSSANSSNPFTNNGPLALQYQLQSGSPAYQTGRVGGVPTGAVCNVGAWDGTVGSIGCDFASGGSSQQGTPAAPVLSVS